MGRDTSGVRGMDVSGKDNYVLAMDVARPGQDLLVVTENGYGKRTLDRRVPPDLARRQGRQDDHVHRGQGPARRRAGRRASTRSSSSSPRTAWSSGPRCAASTATAATSQGVRVMNLREGDEVSAVALVVETEAPTTAADGADAELEPATATARSPAEADGDGVARPTPTDAPDRTATSRGRRAAPRRRPASCSVRRVRYSGSTRERGWSEVE